jgi:putative transposase
MTRNWRTSPRKQLRLPDHDYSLPGSYFVTICASNRRPIFTNKALRRIVLEASLALQRASGHVSLDAFVIMPDHVHGLVHVLEPDEEDRELVGEGCADLRKPDLHSSAQPSPTGPIHANPPLTEIVRLFKTVSARRINTWRRKHHRATGPVWQRSFYDRIARGEDATSAIRYYIANNPNCAADEPALLTDSQLDAREDHLLSTWRLYLPKVRNGA